MQLENILINFIVSYNNIVVTVDGIIFIMG